MTRRNQCGWCLHEDGTRWDRMLTRGVPLAAVTALTPFSEPVALSHVREHGVEATAVPIPQAGHATLADAFAKELVKVASITASSSDRAEDSGSSFAMLHAVELRGQAIDTLAAALDLTPPDVDALLTEAEAVVRGSYRLAQSGLPADGETLAWLVREAGGARVATYLEERAREAGRAA